jgi:DNA-damage-inducible protein J
MWYHESRLYSRDTASMNNKSTFIKIRINPVLKSEVQEIFTELGTNLSDAVTMFLVAVKRKRGLPFSATLPKWYRQYHEAPTSSNVPNAKLVSVMKKNILQKKKFKVFKNTDSLLDELGIPHA